MFNLIRLDANENALGPSPAAMEAMAAAAKENHLYPGNHETLLMQALADSIGGGLTAAHFTTGNGSCDVLRMIVHAFFRPGATIITGTPTFGLYRMLAAWYGAPLIKVPLKNYTFDLEAIWQSIDESTRLIFLCNPNNPTGTFVTHQALADFLQKVPSHVITILDEAYFEYVNAPTFPRSIEFLNDGHNIIIVRTFSKLHGLAGLRIGYGFGPVELIREVRKYKLPFNSGRPAYIAARTAIADEAHKSKSIQMVQEGRDYFYRELRAIGLKYVPTEGNFIFLRELPMPASLIEKRARERGVLLNKADFTEAPENIRITIGCAEENERVISLLCQIFGSTNN